MWWEGDGMGGWSSTLPQAGSIFKLHFIQGGEYGHVPSLRVNVVSYLPCPPSPAGKNHTGQKAYRALSVSVPQGYAFE